MVVTFGLLEPNAKYMITWIISLLPLLSAAIKNKNGGRFLLGCSKVTVVDIQPIWLGEHIFFSEFFNYTSAAIGLPFLASLPSLNTAGMGIQLALMEEDDLHDYLEITQRTRSVLSNSPDSELWLAPSFTSTIVAFSPPALQPDISSSPLISMSKFQTLASRLFFFLELTWRSLMTKVIQSTDIGQLSTVFYTVATR